MEAIAEKTGGSVETGEAKVGAVKEAVSEVIGGAVHTDESAASVKAVATIIKGIKLYISRLNSAHYSTTTGYSCSFF